MSRSTDTTQDMTAAARELAGAIAETAAYREFEQASSALRNDEQARQLLQQFQQAQQFAQMSGGWGGANAANQQREFQQLEQQVINNPTLSRLFKAQEQMIAMLKELNEYMTERLGFDFAELTKPAGGCC